MKYMRVKQHDTTDCKTFSGALSPVLAWVAVGMSKFQAAHALMEGLV